MSKKILIYTSPTCMQCNFTKKYLDDRNIPYETRDISESEEIRNEVKDLGFQAVPVVVAQGHEAFYGFRPDLLDSIIGE